MKTRSVKIKKTQQMLLERTDGFLFVTKIFYNERIIR